MLQELIELHVIYSEKSEKLNLSVINVEKPDATKDTTSTAATTVISVEPKHRPVVNSSISIFVFWVCG